MEIYLALLWPIAVLGLSVGIIRKQISLIVFSIMLGVASVVGLMTL